MCYYNSHSVDVSKNNNNNVARIYTALILYASLVMCTCYIDNSHTQQPYEVGNIIILILQIRKLRQRS